MKSITIIRHAESSGSSLGVLTDFDRPLNIRGLSDAKLMGSVLLNKKINLDIIISSSANRAINTAKIIANQIQIDTNILEHEKIYKSSSKELFNIIAELDDNINSAAFVGHNPTLHILSEKLSAKRFIEFPTCSIVKINFNIKSWVDISIGELEYFIFPELYKIFN